MILNKHGFLAASAAVLLSLPMVSLAAENQEKDQHTEGQRNGRQGSQPPQARPQQQASPQQQAQPQEQANPQQPGRFQQQTNPQQQGRPQQQPGPQQQSRPQQQANPQQQSRPQQQASPQQQFSPRSRTAVSTRHVQQSNQWHSTHANLNSNTVWQRNPNWWRGNASFRNYTGARANYFFAPGFGYYSVPQEYWGRSWNTGAYLPAFFLRYVVNDDQAYGLPVPPYGCSWVWVNTSILLVDLSDGYILDEIDNVW